MKPNILLIASDQQRTDSLSCYGSHWMETPSLTKLADQGVVFERAYCTNPVCMPSRVSLFSGRLMSRHGVWNVGVNAAGEDWLLSHHLSAAGYATAYIGKAHFQSFGGSHAESCEAIAGWDNGLAQTPLPYYGFDMVELALGHSLWGMSGHYGDWLRSQLSAQEFAACRNPIRKSGTEFGGEAYDWSLPTRFHNSTWTADRTVDFLHEQDASQPFFLSVGFQDPHMPHALPLDF